MTSAAHTTLVDSWRVWSSRTPSDAPELYTVQVHRRGLRVNQWWEVRVWCHWVPHWWGKVGKGEPFGSLQAARRDACRVLEVLGGRCYHGVQTISTDATGLQDRWVVLPVDPPPPWCQAHPGPQPWRTQLTTEPGPWTGD